MIVVIVINLISNYIMLVIYYILIYCYIFVIDKILINIQMYIYYELVGLYVYSKNINGIYGFLNLYYIQKLDKKE